MICEPQWEEITGGWKKVHYEELPDLLGQNEG
jgi:hypothetical protein